MEIRVPSFLNVQYFFAHTQMLVFPLYILITQLALIYAVSGVKTCVFIFRLAAISTLNYKIVGIYFNRLIGLLKMLHNLCLKYI